MSCIFQGASLHMICIADIRIHKDHDKRYQGLTRDSWCTRGNAGWRSGFTLSLNNLEWGGLDQKLKEWMKPETNLLERQSNPKETWCRCASALNPRSDHVWKNQKLTKRPNHTHFRIDGLFTLKKDLLPENLLLRKVLLLKVCELKDKTPSLD